MRRRISELSIEKLEINKKKITLNGKEALVQIISMGEEDGLTVPQLAELLNTSDQNVRKRANEHAICTVPIVPSIRKTLLKHNIIPIKTSKVLFVPRDSISALIKVINTPEAWAVYYQLWDDAAELISLKQDLAKVKEENLELESRISFMAAEIESLKNPPPKKKRSYKNRVHTATITKQNLFGGQEVEHIYETIPPKKMSPEQKKAYKTQHSARTMEGIANRLAKETEELGGWLFDQAKKTHVCASRLKSGLLPPEGKHFVKQDIPRT